MYTIALLSCTKSKQHIPAQAGDMYTSVWFCKAKQYALQHCDDWYILSAEHHLIHHTIVIQPYDKTLNRMTAAEKLAWVAIVRKQLVEIQFDKLLVLAGKRYASVAQGYNAVFPLAGLGIGQQLAWFNRNTL